MISKSIFIIFILSLAFPYSPFTTDPVLFFNFDDQGEFYFDQDIRNTKDPNVLQRDSNGDFHILIGAVYNKISSTGQILEHNKIIFESDLDQHPEGKFIIDEADNLLVIVNSLDPVPDTVYYYNEFNEIINTEIVNQEKLHFLALDNNGNPLSEELPFIINRDFTYHPDWDFIQGNDGDLHILTHGRNSGNNLDENLYYIQLSSTGQTMIDFEAVFDDFEYCCDDFEMIQDSDGNIQFIWRALTGIPWVQIDNSGNVLNSQTILPSAPFTSFIQLYDFDYDLIVHLQSLDAMTFSHIYPDGELITGATLPYPENTNGLQWNDSSWQESLGQGQTVHSFFGRYEIDQWPEGPPTRYYQKTGLDGSTIVQPYKVDLLNQFNTIPFDVNVDLEDEPVFIFLEPLVNEGYYFAWVDPDSVYLEVSGEHEVFQDSIFLPVIMQSLSWGAELPVKSMSFSLRYSESELEPGNIDFSEMVELMSTSSIQYSDNMIEFEISDSNHNVIYPETPLAYIPFALISDELTESACQFDFLITSVTDSLDYNLEFPENWQSSFAGTPGDVNVDLAVNILDVVLLVNIVLQELYPTDYQIFAGDMDSDNQISILDIISIINIILAL